MTCNFMVKSSCTNIHCWEPAELHPRSNPFPFVLRDPRFVVVVNKDTDTYPSRKIDATQRSEDM